MCMMMMRRHPRRVSVPEPTPPAKRRRSPENILTRLREREVGRYRSFARRCVSERFSRFNLRLRLDTVAPCAHPAAPLLEKRSPVIELCPTGEHLFALTQNGICAAFHLHTGRMVSILNRDHHECVRSLFFNKANGTLITVSVCADDAYSSLRCCSHPLNELRDGADYVTTPLFGSESLAWPGFI